MYWIGLTGGIGTGKSKVAAILRQRHYPVVDADELARQAIAPGTPGLERLKEKFGTKVLNAAGSLDRKVLADQVFDDKEKLAQLENLIHPIVQQLTADKREALEQAGCEAAFYDVPLLFEKNLRDGFDRVVCVYAPPETQIQRVMKRSGLSEAEVKSRMANQLPINQKVLMADYVIDNSGSLEALDFEVEKCLQAMGLPYQAQVRPSEV